jgi:hypothetical protein
LRVIAIHGCWSSKRNHGVTTVVEIGLFNRANPAAACRLWGVAVAFCHAPNRRAQERERAAAERAARAKADTAVPAFGPRTVCSACGGKRIDVRPNWKEQPVRPTKLRFD